MALLEVTNVQRTYGTDDARTPALRDVSFTVDEGAFVAIMGPSGSGKSTLLHLLGFLDRPTAGSYTFAGKSIGDLNDEELARLRNTDVGFIFQMFHLIPRVSVLANVALPLMYAGIPEREREAKAKEALAVVGMTHRLHHVPSQLSGGERQRTAIARAIINNPRLILADEPTGNLDMASGHVVLEILERLHAQGRTIILVTHETPLADHAQRLIRLSDGYIVGDERRVHDAAHGQFRK
ncbi:MAG: putative ABC transport system ATP-binding protein [Parcubacteria group bacterium Gr01-1014_106]|nr:MAG: putative ABC transport system ATP-binding protein [Parcubacteria group bacterium Gr01-1014_106]